MSPHAAATPWLSVIGIGDDGLDGLSPVARSALAAAEVVFGGARHRAALGDDGREQHGWSSPFRESIDRLLAFRGRSVAVLASGDPMWFGAGASLCRSIPIEEMRIFPAPSAFSLAAARMGWAIDATECLTVHGRALETVVPFVTPGAKLLILCNDGETPNDVAALLRDRGFGDSLFATLSHLGGASESIRRTTAAGWKVATVADLTTLAVDCVAAPGAAIFSPVPGLPDDAFEHDGKLTKREVRAATLAALAPLPGQTLWDVGAGCGSVAIEWCRAVKHAAAVAIEPDEKRLASIRANAMALGVPDLRIVAGRAPEAVAGLAPPDAVFIGGGLSSAGLVEACRAPLPSGGRLVANAVTIEGEGTLIQARERFGGDLTRFAISHAGPVGSFHGWRPMMPVTQWRLHKS